MADESFRKIYFSEDMPAFSGSLTDNVPLIAAGLALLTLDQGVADVREAVTGEGLILEWFTLPLRADLDAIDAFLAAYEGVVTTGQPFEYNSFTADTTQSGAHASKIDETTTPLDAGTYQVLWTSSLRMLAQAANTGVEGKMMITRSDGQVVQQDDAWDRVNRHAFNGAITFQVSAGQTLRTHLSFARLGASGTAEMSGSRITVDKIG